MSDPLNGLHEVGVQSSGSAKSVQSADSEPSLPASTENYETKPFLVRIHLKSRISNLRLMTSRGATDEQDFMR
jgi:hypothetical protein